MRIPSTSRFAVAQADKLLRALAAQASRASQASGIEAVHDLRVSIRQFRRFLSVMKSCFPRAESAQLHRELKTIMALAGDVRDRDIVIELIRKTARSQYRRIVATFRADRGKAAQALRASLREWKNNGASAAWRRALRAAPPQDSSPADSTARNLLPTMAKKYFRSGQEAARDGASMDTLHEFRIAAKHLRYTIDSFEDFYGDSIEDIVDRLKGAQKLLGEIHDCAVARHMIGKAEASTEQKAIRTALKKRQKKKTERFQRDYGCEFSSAATLRHWKDCLG